MVVPLFILLRRGDFRDNGREEGRGSSGLLTAPRWAGKIQRASPHTATQPQSQSPLLT